MVDSSLVSETGLVRIGAIARRQLSPRMPPLRFFVDSRVSEGAQRFDGAPVWHYRAGREFSAGRFVHERHEFIREPRHCATDTDAADVGATADSRHPSPLGNIAVHHGPPAAQLDDTLWRTV